MQITRVLLIGALIVGCGRDSDSKHATPQPLPSSEPEPAAAPTGSASAAAAADPNTVSGTVVETMNSGGYTYAKIDDGKRQIWVAGPETTVAVGSKVGSTTGTPMPGFHSDTLNRTFDQILFVNSLPVTGTAGPNPHGVAPPTVVTDKIEPAKGGKTVADIYANKDALAGKEVTIRGKAVKVNNQILNRNWIHLQDGTGAAGTNDLMVTTMETVDKDAVITVKGKVATHKEFGAGYSYEVLVENATITK